MGGGSAASMTTILKNNKKMLSKKRSRTAMFDYNKKKVEFKVDKASPKLLRRIRVRMKTEQRRKDFILWFVLTFAMVIIITLFMYFL